MSNRWFNYKQDFKNSLPYDITYRDDISRFIFLGRRFVQPWQVLGYKNYLIKTGNYLEGEIIRDLFGNDEPGFLFTASPETCFTDTAGTTQAEPGDPVALWLDQSGNDNHATQPTTANRPILGRKPEGGVTANSVGSGFDITEPGKPDRYYLFFGGASDPRWMQTPFSGAARDDFIGTYWVGYRQGPDQTGYICHAAGTENDGREIGFGHLLSNGEDRVLISTRTNSGAQTPNTGRIAMADWDRNVSEGVFGFNGSRQAANVGAGSQDETLTIGCRTPSSPEVFYEGELSAMILRQGGGLDNNQIELVERFTAAKVPEFIRPVIDGVPTIGVS